MKYFDVVANCRACLWRDVRAISPKPPNTESAKNRNRKWNSDLLGCMTSSSEDCRKNHHIVECCVE